MPFVHIFHAWPEADVRAAGLSDAVHEALVEAFGVPPDDRFQALSSHSVKKGALRITPSFLGVKHSPEAVFVQITCAPGRTLAQKQALYAAIADKARAKAALRKEDVIVSLVETARENWSFGCGVAHFAA